MSTLAKMRAKALLLVLLGFCAGARAVPLADIDIGDVYYLRRPQDDSVLVSVIAVNPASNRVKVQYENGAVDWVGPGSLLTQRQKEADDAEQAAQYMRLFGCLLSPDDPACKEKPWQAGLAHPQYAHVISAQDRNHWFAEPGYVWETPGQLGPVVWKPGTVHPVYANVVATHVEGQWIPRPGFRWQNPPNLGPVVWTPNLKHPSYAFVLAGNKPLEWLPAPGYRWANPGKADDLSVLPK